MRWLCWLGAHRFKWHWRMRSHRYPLQVARDDGRVELVHSEPVEVWTRIDCRCTRCGARK